MRRPTFLIALAAFMFVVGAKPAEAQETASPTSSVLHLAAPLSINAGPSSLQLQQPMIDAPRKRYGIFIAMFAVGVAMIPVSSLGYVMSGYCDGSSCEGREYNPLWFIALAAGASLLIAGITGWIVRKRRYNHEYRRYEEQQTLRATAW